MYYLNDIIYGTSRKSLGSSDFHSGCQHYSGIPFVPTGVRHIAMASILRCGGGFSSANANSKVRVDDVFDLIQARRHFPECHGCCFDWSSLVWS